MTQDARMRASISDSTRIPSGHAGVLVDDLLARYVEWREAGAEVAEVYRRWSVAPPADEPAWFAAYTAALDREEASANAYAQSIGDVERWLPGWGGHPGDWVLHG